MKKNLRSNELQKAKQVSGKEMLEKRVFPFE